MTSRTTSARSRRGRRLRAADAARADARGRELRAEPARVHGALGDRRALRPGQLVMHPGPMNRGVEIDAAVADGAQSLVTAQVRAGSSSAWPCSTTCSPRAGRRRSRPRWRWRDALGRTSCRDLVIRGARVLDPVAGWTRSSTSASTAARSRSSAQPRRRTGTAWSRRPPVLAPAFVDPHVHLRSPGREDEETIASGTDRGGRRRLLRDPRDAEHRAGRRLGGRARGSSRRRAARRSSRPGSSPRSRRARTAAS